MAVITRNPREILIREKGGRETKEALLAGPAAGCNRFTIRRISLGPDGCTARTSFDRTTAYFIHRGRVALSHHDGELDLLSPGDTVIVHPDEAHHLHNIDKTEVVLIKVAPQ
ncbi:MAG: hypothetical protein K8S62_08070 [Candidatus Sabulitectum sp.]|nr:hypothetical protein [Candidatus Sabulitectum sp.]